MKIFKKVSFIFSIIPVFVLSCTKSNNNKADFPETQTLVGEKIMTINPYMLGSMEVVDNLLVVINSRGEHIFQIYNTGTDSLILEIGKKGKGPGEFFDPTLALHSNISNNNKGKTIEIFDVYRRRLTNINMSSTLKLDSLVYNEVRLPNSIGVVNRVFYRSDSVIYYEGEDEGRFCIYNIHDSSKMKIPYSTPTLDFNIDKVYEKYIFKSEVEINISRKIIVTAPLAMGRLDFFDLKGEYLHSSVFENPESLEEAIARHQEDDIKRYIGDIKSDTDKIYALNMNFYSNKKNIEQNIKSELLLFKWNGTPIKRYQLDRFIPVFAVDSKNQCIYGYAPYEPDYPIIKYKL
jgi:hypothetical protein